MNHPTENKQEVSADAYGYAQDYALSLPGILRNGPPTPDRYISEVIEFIRRNENWVHLVSCRRARTIRHTAERLSALGYTVVAACANAVDMEKQSPAGGLFTYVRLHDAIQMIMAEPEVGSKLVVIGHSSIMHLEGFRIQRRVAHSATFDMLPVEVVRLMWSNYTHIEQSIRQLYVRDSRV